MKEEKKLNDEELITTFYRCCGGSANSCANCYYRIGTSRCNMKKLNRDILDLIRRLQYGYSSASKASEEWKVKYEQEREENVAQKSEIERLKEENEHLDGCAKQFLADYQKCEIANTEYCHRNIAKAVEETAKEILQNCGEKHTEIYNRFVFKNSDYGDEEINAIINFSDILYFEIREYFKEKYGVEVE